MKRIHPTLFRSPQSDVYSFGRIMLQVCSPTHFYSRAMIHLNDQQILTGKVPYHYYAREAQVVHAISKGVIPKRPSQELVTDRQWTFMQRCWTPVDADQSRPGDEEIVEFVRQELSNREGLKEVFVDEERQAYGYSSPLQVVSTLAPLSEVHFQRNDSGTDQ
jgi:hypothetical protein